LTTASKTRETALSEMLGRLGNTHTADERYNNGFAHYSMAVFSSYLRAFEDRMSRILGNLQVTVLEAVPVEGKKNSKVIPEMINALDMVGKTITIDRPIFENTMMFTKWIENFYQESPSINARAREDQVTIGTEAFKTVALSGFQHGERDEALSTSKSNR